MSIRKQVKNLKKKHAYAFWIQQRIPLATSTWSQVQVLVKYNNAVEFYKIETNRIAIRIANRSALVDSMSDQEKINEACQTGNSPPTPCDSLMNN